MKKRILSIILALALLLTLLPATALTVSAATYSGTCGAEGDGSNLTWTLDTSTGVLTIEGNGEMAEPTWSKYGYMVSEVLLPYGLTTICDEGFRSCYHLSSVTIPGSVTSIGSFAFYNCDLTSVSLGTGLTSIGKSAFEKCSKLKELNIPNSVMSVGESAFSGCAGLTNVSIGNGVITIGDRAFSNCANLTYFTIPEKVTTIGDYAFMNCTSLADITIPGSVRSLGKGAFYGCVGMGNFTIPDTVTNVGDALFKGCEGLLNVTIGNGVNCLSDSMFYGCTALKNVTIGNRVTSIDTNAFYGCLSLTSIAIPSSVTSIGRTAFSGCKNLKTISLDMPTVEAWFSSVKTITDATFGEHVRTIGEKAFAWCSELKSITIKDGTKTIGDSAFYGCSSLKNVVIGNSVTSIGKMAFQSCKAITSVTLSNSMTSIGVQAFKSCTSLKEITIPSSVRSIQQYAFYDCNSLKSVKILNPKCEIWDYYSTLGDQKLTTVYGYSSSTAEAYAKKYGYTFVSLGVQPTEPQPAGQFVDVSAAAFYAKAVDWAVANNVTKGTGGGKFSPDDTCTRGQVVTFLWRAKGSPEPTALQSVGDGALDVPFDDISSDAYYYKAVLWAVENGITSGLDKTHFGPNAGCTRGQVVTFLWRAEGKPNPTSTETPFTDVDANGFYYKAMCWAVENKITTGTGKTTFAPENTCTRGQIVTFLYRDLGA